jgi:hypothetical protein
VKAGVEVSEHGSHGVHVISQNTHQTKIVDEFFSCILGSKIRSEQNQITHQCNSKKANSTSAHIYLNLYYCISLRLDYIILKNYIKISVYC